MKKLSKSYVLFCLFTEDCFICQLNKIKDQVDRIFISDSGLNKFFVVKIFSVLIDRHDTNPPKGLDNFLERILFINVPRHRSVLWYDNSHKPLNELGAGGSRLKIGSEVCLDLLVFGERELKDFGVTKLDKVLVNKLEVLADRLGSL